jgi:hypothetical protein
MSVENFTDDHLISLLIPQIISHVITKPCPLLQVSIDSLEASTEKKFTHLLNLLIKEAEKPMHVLSAVRKHVSERNANGKALNSVIEILSDSSYAMPTQEFLDEILSESNEQLQMCHFLSPYQKTICDTLDVIKESITHMTLQVEEISKIIKLTISDSEKIIVIRQTIKNHNKKMNETPISEFIQYSF